MPIGNGYVGMAKETAFGTAAAPTRFLPVNSAEATSDPQNYYPEVIRNSRSKSRGIPMGLLHEATIEMDAEPNSLGDWLLAAMGTVNSTQPDVTNAPTAYEHVFTPGNTLPSYTLEKYDGLMTERIIGSKVDTLTLSVEAGSEGALKVEAELKAQSVSDQSSQTATNYDDQPPFTFNSVTVEKDGQVNDNIRSLELEISNNLKDDHFALGQSRSVKELPEGMREVTLSAEMYFNNKQEYLSFLAGETGSFKFTFDGALIGGSVSEKLILELPNLVYDSFETPMGGADDALIASIEATAIIDAASGYEVRATLTNTITSY